MARLSASGVTTVAAPPHNLPAALSTFVGRDDELRETRRLLGATRVLTLIGAGGVGKTRLALQLAAAVFRDHPDGVWVVDLTTVADARRVARVVAGVLGLHDRAGTPLPRLVADALQGKRVLLVLDNCEHLVEACARLAEYLLRTCQDLQVLATSRTPLRVDGEQLWRVPSLARPEPPDTPERVGRSAAAELFVQRAAAAEPTFALNRQTAGAIASICRRLDGIPLALELAAARVGALSVEQIATRLDDRFRLLVGGHRTAPPRQQTLLATLDWSHGLLDEAERTLFRRLAVFGGGWTLDMAEAVTAGDGIERGDVPDLVRRLVDQSLVLAEADGGGDHRYRFLETIRAYAHQYLADACELGALRDRHAAAYRALADEAGPYLGGAQPVPWLDRLEREHDNFRTALDWLGDRGRLDEALELAASLVPLWYTRGYAMEGRERLERLLARAGAAQTESRRTALRAISRLAFQLGDYAAQYRFGAENREISEAMGLTAGVAESLGQMGAARFQQGRYAEARQLQDEAIALYERHRLSIPGGTHLFLARANTELEDGNFAAARHWFEVGLAKADVTPSARAALLVSLARLGLFEGDLARARALGEQSLAIRRELGEVRDIAISLTILGRIAAAGGERDRARALYAESVPLHQQTGSRWGQAYVLEGMAGLLASERPVDALRLAGAADELRTSIGRPIAPAERPIMDRLLAPARQRLSPTQQQSAWADGRALGTSQALALGLQLMRQDDTGHDRTALTGREREVARLVAHGRTNRQIATELVVTESTAAKHIEHILSKLGLSSRAQIAAWAAEHHLLDARSS
jgi:predicted ATPase/DNA-binding CsgD family transcriptional regulator